ncbi:hypothetical protein GBF38_000025, partial [Nibea albiflora]
ESIQIRLRGGLVANQWDEQFGRNTAHSVTSRGIHSGEPGHHLTSLTVSDTGKKRTQKTTQESIQIRLRGGLVANQWDEQFGRNTAHSVTSRGIHSGEPGHHLTSLTVSDTGKKRTQKTTQESIQIRLRGGLVANQWDEQFGRNTAHSVTSRGIHSGEPGHHLTSLTVSDTGKKRTQKTTQESIQIRLRGGLVANQWDEQFGRNTAHSVTSRGIHSGEPGHHLTSLTVSDTGKKRTQKTTQESIQIRLRGGLVANQWDEQFGRNTAHSVTSRGIHSGEPGHHLTSLTVSDTGKKRTQKTTQESIQIRLRGGLVANQWDEQFGRNTAHSVTSRGIHSGEPGHHLTSLTVSDTGKKRTQKTTQESIQIRLRGGLVANQWDEQFGRNTAHSVTSRGIHSGEPGHHLTSLTVSDTGKKRTQKTTQ